ncbi:MAG: hypothetical protein EPN20_13415, partial [Magnetospirillum sp.]
MNTQDHMLSRYDGDALAAAGLVIHAPGLPYPPMATPGYRMVDAGGWRLSQAFIIASPGYFLPIRPLDWVTTLLSRGNVTWMSVTPMEIESQMPHLAAAKGMVVVCGLGLGVT